LLDLFPRRGCLLVGAFVASTILATGVQAASEMDATLYSVMDRSRPGYDAQGVRLGSWLFLPSLMANTSFDSNVFASGANPQSETIFNVRPELRIKSDWNRHSFEAFAAGEFARYRRFSSEDHNNFFAGAAGSADISRGFVAFGSVEYAKQHEERGTGESFAGFDKPVPFEQITGRASVARRFNRLTVSAGGAVDNYDYEDVTRDHGATPVDQDYRDRNVFSLSSRVAYEISPMTSVFVEVGWNKRDFRTSPLNSDGWRGTGGVSFELSRLIQGEAFVGYMSQNYDSPTILDVSSYTYGGNLKWMPTPLTTVTLLGERKIGESSFGGGFSSRIKSDIGVRVDHELLRNLIASGRLGFEWDEFQGTGRNDEYVKAGASLLYLLNPYFSVSGDYRYTDFSTNAPGVNDYRRHQGGVTVTAKY
jgi:hypothetical protein